MEADKLRPPVLVSDLALLLNRISTQHEADLVVLAIALVAFWGTARLGELVLDDVKKCLPIWGDILWGRDYSYVKITIFGAKTAKPGEVHTIFLWRQKSKLDPVQVLKRLYDFRPRRANNPVFGFKTEGEIRVFKKTLEIERLRVLWNQNQSSKRQAIYDHSLRIGGASLRWNLGASRDEIKAIGRWASDAYKIYLRKFSEKEMKETVDLLEELRCDN